MAAVAGQALRGRRNQAAEHDSAAGHDSPAVRERKTRGPEQDKMTAAVAGHDSPAVRERKTPDPEQN